MPLHLEQVSSDPQALAVPDDPKSATKGQVAPTASGLRFAANAPQRSARARNDLHPTILKLHRPRLADPPALGLAREAAEPTRQSSARIRPDRSRDQTPR